MENVETIVNQWGEWVNLNWKYSQLKCENYINNRISHIFKYRVKAGDMVELRDGRVGRVYYINYLGNDTWCIEVIIRDTIITVSSIWDVTKVYPVEVKPYALR